MVQDFQRREEFVPEIFLAAADAGQGRGGLQDAAIAHLGRVVRFDAPDRRDSVAVDAVGPFHRVELRLVFGKDFAALGEAVVVHQNVEIVPDRLGEFRLRIHQIHDAQIGRETGGEALEALLRNAAACGIGPHRGHATIEIRSRLADRARGHQGMTGGAVLAAPGQRRAARCGCRLGLRRGSRPRPRWPGLAAFRQRASEDVIEDAKRPAAAGRLRARLAA